MMSRAMVSTNRRELSTATMEAMSSQDLPRPVDSPGRYASALFNAARKMNSLEDVILDVNRMKEMNESTPVLADFLKNPTLPKAAKVEILGQVIKRSDFNMTFSHFLMVVAENGRTTELPKTLVAFQEIIASLKGEVICKVTTTEPLTIWELALLKKRIKKRFFANKPDAEVTLETAIDENILGGLTIQVGDRFMDLSTRTELRKLQDSIVQSVA